MSPTACFIHRLFSLLLVSALALGASPVQASSPAGAADRLRSARPLAAISVTTLDDELNSDGDCALREAVAAANSNLAVDACPAGEGAALDSISFAVSGTLTLTLGLTVTAGGPLEISGGQAITLSGAGGMRPFYVEAGADLALAGLTVQDGQAPRGGAIYNNGDLTLQSVRLSGNAVTETGGAIFNADNASLSLAGSTLDGNQAGMAGGGLFNEPLAALSIQNSTIVSNTAAEFGGGLYNSGPAEIVHATFYENRAGFGGALYATNNTTFSNSILAGSPAGGNCAGAPPTDGGYNLDSEDTCNFDPINSSLINTDPLLYLPLGDYGGPTPTLPLLPVSPAIDAAGAAACLPEDQRGEPRPADGNADGVAACDMGAFELQLGVLAVTTLDDELNGDGDCACAVLTASVQPAQRCQRAAPEPDFVRFEAA
jgi:CSLREA domain-containing protein